MMEAQEFTAAKFFFIYQVIFQAFSTLLNTKFQHMEYPERVHVCSTYCRLEILICRKKLHSVPFPIFTLKFRIEGSKSMST